MINFTIETNILRGLLHVAPKKDVRFYLRAIHLDFRRGFAVATAGACMVLARTRFLADAAFSIPRDMAADALRQVSKRADFIHGTFDADAYVLTIETDKGTLTRTGDEVVTVRFPDVVRVLPREFADMPADGAQGFDPDLLARVQEALCAIAGTKRAIAIMRATGPSTPAIVYLPGSSRAVGVVMPARLEPLDDAALLDRVQSFTRPPVVEPGDANSQVI